jgi:hypothetical protein
MFIFLHMPKTGGHSFKQAMFRRFGIDRVSFVANPSQFFEFLDGPRASTCKALHGHMPYGAADYLPKASAHYVVLRDPVDRFVSSYFHMLTRPEHPAHRKINEEGISLLDYARDPCLIRYSHHNSQTLRCATYDFLPDPEDQNYWWLGNQKSDAQVLREAKENLEYRIVNFGIFEEFDASYRDFCNLLGVTVGTIPRENVASHRLALSQLDTATISKIQDANYLDMEFYDFALKLWHNKTQMRVAA